MFCRPIFNFLGWDSITNRFGTIWETRSHWMATPQTSTVSSIPNLTEVSQGWFRQVHQACKAVGWPDARQWNFGNMQLQGSGTLATCKAVGWPACKARQWVGQHARAVELWQNARQWVGQHARQWKFSSKAVDWKACLYHCKKLFVACNLVSIFDHRPLLLSTYRGLCPWHINFNIGRHWPIK